MEILLLLLFLLYDSYWYYEYELVSVIVPTYNSMQFLGETLDSLKNQTYTSWELVISDDCSSDGTEELVKQFSASVPQPVIFSRNPTNLGLSQNRNNAIELANSNWIALLDSDDLWEPTHLEDLVRTAQITNSDFIHSGSIQFDSITGNILRTIAPSSSSINALPFSIFDKTYRIQPSSIFFSSNLFLSVGKFDINLRSVEDFDFYLRSVRSGFQISYTGFLTVDIDPMNHRYLEILLLWLNVRREYMKSILVGLAFLSPFAQEDPLNYGPVQVASPGDHVLTKH